MYNEVAQQESIIFFCAKKCGDLKKKRILKDITERLTSKPNSLWLRLDPVLLKNFIDFHISYDNQYYDHDIDESCFAEYISFEDKDTIKYRFTIPQAGNMIVAIQKLDYDIIDKDVIINYMEKFCLISLL